MSAKLKSQRGFVAVTLITILAIALVIIAYATILGTFKGGQVTVVTVQAEIWYSEQNSTTANWTSTLPNVANGSQWYTKLNITNSGGYTGLANVTWTLHNSTDDSPIGGATITTVNYTLTGGYDTIYAAVDGTTTAGNMNWGSYTTVAGDYYVKAEIKTVP